MTVQEAYQVLGLPPGVKLHEIKKKYRKLMMQVHPDANLHTKEKYAYSAQEINTAYSILKKEPCHGIHMETRHDKSIHPSKKQKPVWNAPVNENAYKEREILQNIEDYDGTVLSSFCIAKGKYMWTIEEDFSLFLLSMYQCSKQLLEETDLFLHRKKSPPVHHQIQMELTYLLTQQFIAGTDLLKELAKEEAPDQEGHQIFYIPSMLEPSGKTISLKFEEPLYPSKIKQHKLYLKNREGQEIGYLSFMDDRLYYVVVPLFEQKKVQVRIQTAQKQLWKNSALKYHHLHLWLKLSSENIKQMPENLNMQIEQLLEQYKFSK